ncbi:hypothetical protein [Micromonospora mirobrigensis]|uniref:Uncharacterized protein n=1 Tax=Micromonospora mirobrigensis TaxID=262898 RepID=A0A1C4Z3H4_9ACTN|nr:hypothetical protein [Micromonospora mirobrigensis]SCF27518.1 hypothetical protein GA0070564_10537 [Micromonospora mirobrigensis]
MTAQPDLDLVFWSGSVRTRPFVDHVRAARAGGFTSMAVAADTYRAAIGSGLSPQAVIGMAEDAGVPIRHFEAFTDWAPIDLAAGGGASGTSSMSPVERASPSPSGSEYARSSPSPPSTPPRPHRSTC